MRVIVVHDAAGTILAGAVIEEDDGPVPVAAQGQRVAILDVTTEGRFDLRTVCLRHRIDPDTGDLVALDDDTRTDASPAGAS
ncbi:hypothetical protein [Microbacterium sp. zg-YB36]|uniref:hypothetical protein n=1 Tax=Microbacterium sp. zg-YB36 TaxID=2969407 RepID=UPI00214A99C9|nr:hypothetical protein [Microbacterium sp. zg-YB36]MDL5350745.1 hypothetical protein [Microbacterium sp. zg-YB36]